MKTRIVQLGTGAYRLQKERDFEQGRRWVFATSTAHCDLAKAKAEQTDFLNTSASREFTVVAGSERETPTPQADA